MALRRVAGNVHLLVVLALCVLAVVYGIAGEVWAAAIAGVALLAVTGGLVTSVAAVAAALVLNNLPVAMAALVGAGTHLLSRLALTRGRDRPDLNALTAVFAELPRPLYEALRAAAGSDPVHTGHMLAQARQGDREAWSGLLAGGSGETFDGAVIADGRGRACSQYAAEAVGVSFALANNLGRPLDANILGVAAAAIPLSLAGERVKTAPGEQVLHISANAVLEGLMSFAKQPAGDHIATRAGHAASLSEFRDEVPRERLASLTGREVARFRLLYRGVMAGAVLVALGEVGRDALTSLVRLPQRTLTAVSRPRGTASVRRPRPWGGRVGRARRKIQGLWRLLGPWRDLPVVSRVAWVIVRPALAVAAVAAVAIDGSSAFGLGLIALAVIVRGLRLPWLAMGLALAALTATPVAGALLVARVTLGELMLLSLGHGSVLARRRGGVRAIITARRRISKAADLGEGDVAEAREALRRAALEDDEAALERAVELVAATWAEAHPLVLLQSLKVAARGALFGQWSGGGHLNFSGEFRRLFVLETAGESIARWALFLVGGLAGASLFPGLVASAGQSRALAAALAICLAVPLSARPRRVITPVVACGVAVPLLGQAALGPLFIGAAAGLCVSPARQIAGAYLLAGQDRRRPWPAPPGADRKQRRHWVAADAAATEGRVGLAIDLLTDLAGDVPAGSALAAECQGWVGLLHLDAGRYEQAAACLDRIDGLDLQGGGAFAAGHLSRALGDDRGAERRLATAVASLGRRSPLMVRARLELADVRARLDDPEGAKAVLADLRSRPLAVPGFAAIIETEVAVAAALLRGGDQQGALSRLEEVSQLDLSDNVGVREYGEDVVTALSRAMARAELLRGRIALQTHRPEEAQGLLASAGARLSSRADAGLRATARVLEGVAHAFRGHHRQAVLLIGSGVETLEARRTQLRVSDRRTTMITSEAETYRFALQALAAAGRGGATEAAPVAAALIESLRRSAISAVLRAGPLPLGDDARALARRLERIEQGLIDNETDVASLRAQLTKAMSAEFAAAYLPAPVSPAQLRRTAHRFGHILSYHVPPTGLPGWCVWLRPDGRGEMHEVGTSESERELLSELALGRGLTDGTTFVPWAEASQRWERLTRSLLPEQLRQELEARQPEEGPVPLLVVPDGPLAAVPWAALSVGGEPLVHRALVQLVPSVDVIGAAAPVARRRAARVLAHDTNSTPAELAGLRELEVHQADTHDSFLRALQSQAYEGAYVLAHGAAMGMEQQLELNGGLLSAASALSYRWPDWVVFAACLVGRLSPRAGQEPLGLGISCMLGGSSTVIGSVVELTLTDASELGAQLAAALARGQLPAAALRAAQLDYLQRNPLASVADGLGLICLSTRPLKRPADRSRRVTTSLSSA